MKFKSAVAPLLLYILITGCASSSIGIRTGNSSTMHESTPPGNAYSRASIQAEVRPGAYFGLLFLGYILTGIHDDYWRWSYGASSRKPPELAEERTVIERDCSQVLGPFYANLRCK